MFHERMDGRGRVGYSRGASRAHGHYQPPYLEGNFYASKDS
jgi:hypothetical protein